MLAVSQKNPGPQLPWLPAEGEGEPLQNVACECLMRFLLTLSPVIPSVPWRGFECLVLVPFTLHGKIVFDEYTV